jgi:peptidoglycan/xylan/chitin deacetylase (PgdA/CDA1 family)
MVLLAAACCVLLVAGCARGPVPRMRATGPHGGRSGFVRGSVGMAALAASAASEPARPAMPAPEVDLRAFFGRPLRRAPDRPRKVAITLDDGPSAHTAAILEAFRHASASATFFFVGNRTPRYAAVAREAVRSGFEVEDHTWDHEEIKGVGVDATLKEIDRAQEELTRDTGHTPVFVRPPAGHWDDAAMRAITERGMVMALWSLHGQDTGPGTHAATIAHNVVASAQAGDIILLHETNPETVQALPEIIAGLRRKGLEPVTLLELLSGPRGSRGGPPPDVGDGR